MSGNSSALSACPLSSLVTVNTTLALLLLMMFPVALLLNLTAAWVSLQLQTSSPFIVYFKNLIAADLLITLTIPLKAANLLGASLHLQMFACRYSDVVLYSGLYTGICLMGMISLDRFFKIVRPRGMVFGQSRVFSIASSSVIWVTLFFGTALPTMILTDRYPTVVSADICLSMKGPAGLFYHKMVVSMMDSVFWLVTLMILFCYVCITLKVLQSFRNSGSSNTHGKKQTKLRVFLILTVYSVCFVPLHLTRIPYVLHNRVNGDCAQVLLTVLHRSVLWISLTNVCLDPLLYIFLCKEFREKLMMKIHGICVCLFARESE